MRKISFTLFCLVLLFSSFSIDPPVSPTIISPPDLFSSFNISKSDTISPSVTPYDFYAKTQLSVGTPIDTVFLMDDNARIRVVSPSPCYVLLKTAQYDDYEGIKAYKVSNYNYISGLYSRTIDYSNESALYARLIVTGFRTLQKATSALPDHPLPLSLEVSPSETGMVSSLQTSSTSNTVVDIDGEADGIYEGHVSQSVSTDAWKLVYDADDCSDETPSNSYIDQSIFTCNSTTDVEMFVLDANDSVVAHVTDYVGTGDYDWGSDVRYHSEIGSTVSTVVLIPQVDYLQWFDTHYKSPAGYTDFYVGCRTPLLANLTNFPNLKEDDIIQSDAARTSSTYYDAISWALGSWHNSYSYDDHGAYNIMYVIDGHGFTWTSPTDEDVILKVYAKDGHVTNIEVKSNSEAASGKSYGYSWESKLGINGPRIMHPSGALVNDDEANWAAYGHIVQCYKANPNYNNSREIIYANAEFSAEDDSAIERLKATATEADFEAFATFYANMQDTIRARYLNNLSLLYQHVEEYRNMVSLCSQNEGLLGIVLDRLSSGDAIAAMVVRDMSNYGVGSPAILEETSTFAPKGTMTDIAKSTIIAKCILASIRQEELSSMKLSESICYSNDSNRMEVMQDGGNLKIRFSCKEGEHATLAVGLTGSFPSFLLNDVEMTDGWHDFSMPMDKKGMYMVSLKVNGKLFSRKVISN